MRKYNEKHPIKCLKISSSLWSFRSYWFLLWGNNNNVSSTVGVAINHVSMDIYQNNFWFWINKF